MEQGEVAFDAEDAEAIAAYDAALRDFTIELNRLHIEFGAPSYAAIVKASVRPKLTKAGINEALSGKRLPSVDALIEFVRVVSNPLPALSDGPTPRCKPGLADEWRARWRDVKFAQRRAQAPWRRLRDTVRETLDKAVQDAAAVRTAAYGEAESIIAAARKAALADVWKHPAAVPTGRNQSILPDLQWDSATLAAALPRRLLPWNGPFWFAVPTNRPLYPLVGGPNPIPIAELVPNTWYLATHQDELSLIAQCQDGRTGRLMDVTGIQRG
ncbi:hypothetical protein [Streptomyces sp. NRRL WC-3725]|uniref:hypothetical protein n=1 Tax=Streptomyces sp. NRRL WC-3725 TaxID=1463933 RepID=UPI0004C74E59|nr:hypothetical protein [Streptomyces sp. NRRL WC-3725]